jgi:hypothetical protein
LRNRKSSRSRGSDGGEPEDQEDATVSENPSIFIQKRSKQNLLLEGYRTAVDIIIGQWSEREEGNAERDASGKQSAHSTEQNKMKECLRGTRHYFN